MNQRKTITPGDPNALQRLCDFANRSMGLGARPQNDTTMATLADLKKRGSSDPRSAATGTGGGEFPSTPSELVTTGKPDGVVVSWARPIYAGHSHTEVWRSDTDSLEDAEHISDIRSTQFYDFSVGNFYYFLRHKGASSGPFSDGIAGGSVVVVVPSPLMRSVDIVTESAVSEGVSTSGWRSPTVMIRLAGSFESWREWSATNMALGPEEGNPVQIEIHRNGDLIQTISPTKIQSSLSSANGDVRYLHFLNQTVIDTPPEGANQYTFTATRTLGGSFGFKVNVVLSGG